MICSDSRNPCDRFVSKLGPNGGAYRQCVNCDVVYEMLQDQVYHDSCNGINHKTNNVVCAVCGHSRLNHDGGFCYETDECSCRLFAQGVYVVWPKDWVIRMSTFWECLGFVIQELTKLTQSMGQVFDKPENLESRFSLIEVD